MFDIEPDNTPGATLRRILVVLLAAIVMAFGIAARADSVKLYDQIGVDGPDITLAQVAQLQGPDALVHAGLVLNTFTDNRTEFTLTLDAVENALDKAGVNWARVSLRGFDACRVTRIIPPPVVTPNQGQQVAANIETPIGLDTKLTLRGLIEEHIIERVDEATGDIRIDFSERDAKKLDVAILGRSIEIEPSYKNTLGKVPVVVRLYDAKRVAETIHVSAHVKHVLLAVVADGPISRGEVFTRSHLKVQECINDSDDIQPVTDPGVIIGQESAVALNPGEMISVRKVKSPILVKRGQVVNVRCFVGSLVVRTGGVATENGSLDDLIRFRNDSTGEEFVAVVTGRNQAVIPSSVSTTTQAATSTAMADTLHAEASP